MKTALIVASLSLVTCLSAHAYEIETGAVMICDTEKQVERYVQVFDGNPRAAIRAVNTEENDPNACALADVTYVQGPTSAWPGAARTRSGLSRSRWLE